jgi:formate hydrogenlyase subunit 6/NADH:ubiquinone oxidoreductase subunit I
MEKVMDNGWRLDRMQIDAWLESLVRDGREVCAPFPKAGVVMMGLVTSAADVFLAEGKTQFSPKEYVFPRTETIFSYRKNGDDVVLVDPTPEGTQRVLFAVRPCDAAGLVRLDAVLGRDPAYAERRARTTVVTLGCDAPAPECFCTAVDGHPHGTEGSDVEMVSTPGGVLLRALTGRGRELVTSASTGWRAATDEDWRDAGARGVAAEESMRREILPREAAGELEGAFENPAWEEIGRRCLSCSICAYVCPSCSCFDVQDEGSASCGDRCRSWDACSLRQFTLHASGHNPRSDQGARYRQRLLHKFSYYPAQMAGKWMCVGCGRCAKMCPVGIDIHEAVGAVLASRPKTA